MALPEGAVVGMLGDGQLGKMMLQAATNLGYRGHVYAPRPGGPASQVCDRVTVGSFEDEAALLQFADNVDVVTLEWENVPVSAVRTLVGRVPVYPGARALEVCQARHLEKQFANDHGCETTPWRFATTPDEAAEYASELGNQVILKTDRMGYDGKGQVRLDLLDDAREGFGKLGYVPVVVEALCPFVCEISVVVARGIDGATRSFVAVENQHRNHVLSRTLVPAPVSEEVVAQAREAAERLVVGLEYVGVLAVEFFVTADDRVLVNEMAPRPHNSGHWSIEGARTSQFEQAEALLAEGWSVHRYGKRQVRAGRKMGHATRLLDD